MVRLLLAVASAVLLAGCAARDNPQAQDANPSRVLFQRNCAACHGSDGGGKQIGTLRVPSLGDGRAVSDPDEHLFTQVRDGGGGMPPFKYSLTDEQIQDLIRFVREDIQKRAASRP